MANESTFITKYGAVNLSTDSSSKITTMNVGYDSSKSTVKAVIRDDGSIAPLSVTDSAKEIVTTVQTGGVLDMKLKSDGSIDTEESNLSSAASVEVSDDSANTYGLASKKYLKESIATHNSSSSAHSELFNQLLESITELYTEKGVLKVHSISDTNGNVINANGKVIVNGDTDNPKYMMLSSTRANDIDARFSELDNKIDDKQTKLTVKAGGDLTLDDDGNLDVSDMRYNDASVKERLENIESKEEEWSGKQDALVSAKNIKTINGTPILGSGDIEIKGGGDDVALTDSETGTVPTTGTEKYHLQVGSSSAYFMAADNTALAAENPVLSHCYDYSDLSTTIYFEKSLDSGIIKLDFYDNITGEYEGTRDYEYSDEQKPIRREPISTYSDSWHYYEVYYEYGFGGAIEVETYEIDNTVDGKLISDITTPIKWQEKRKYTKGAAVDTEKICGRTETEFCTSVAPIIAETIAASGINGYFMTSMDTASANSTGFISLCSSDGKTSVNVYNEKHTCECDYKGENGFYYAEVSGHVIYGDRFSSSECNLTIDGKTVEWSIIKETSQWIYDRTSEFECHIHYSSDRFGDVCLTQGSQEVYSTLEICKGKTIPSWMSIQAASYAESKLGYPAYSTASSYLTGTVVNLDGDLYTCTTEITAVEEWNSEHWKSTNLLSIVPQKDTSLKIDGAYANAKTVGEKLDAKANAKKIKVYYAILTKDEGTLAYVELDDEEKFVWMAVAKDGSLLKETTSVNHKIYYDTDKYVYISESDDPVYLVINDGSRESEVTVYMLNEKEGYYRHIAANSAALNGKADTAFVQSFKTVGGQTPTVENGVADLACLFSTKATSSDPEITNPLLKNSALETCILKVVNNMFDDGETEEF